MREWRDACKVEIGYADGGIYNVSALKWTQTAYMQPQMHPYDRYFYDAATHQYTVERWLSDLVSRYGKIDAALVWPTYPNIGIDDRNQFDLIRAMPGGVPAIRTFVRALHGYGVRVLWPYNPWDHGTLQPTEGDHATAMAALLAESGADGLNGDTMPYVPYEFYNKSAAAGRPAALEPEGGGTEASAKWETLGWGYWKYPLEPQVDKWKWLDGRRLTNVCDRWAKNHTDNLQAAWFNGDGFETWENVWGTWNGLTARDAEAVRRVGALARFFGGSGYLTSRDWMPHAPTRAPGAVYASRFPHPDPRRAQSGEAFYTMVNRVARNVSGALLALNVSAGARVFDCYAGIELTPVPTERPLPHPTATSTMRSSGDGAPGPREVVISSAIEAIGYGGILVVDGSQMTPALTTFLGRMQAMTAGQPLAKYDSTWRVLPQKMAAASAAPPPTRPAPVAEPPAGMVAIPAAAAYTFRTRGVEIEGDDAHGVDVQFPWEAAPQREHEHTMSVSAFHIDRYPVTCVEYSAYLRASGYAPADPTHFLRNWKATRALATGDDRPLTTTYTYPPEYANKPVTYVSLSDARAFCAFNGKRLPHVWEWQLAAQGTNASRLYPWGDEDDSTGHYRPILHSGNQIPGPDDVDAHAPQGDSPYGVSDMVGNVWQLTDEFEDAHTRYVVLRGSSNYRTPPSPPQPRPAPPRRYPATRARRSLPRPRPSDRRDSHAWLRCLCAAAGRSPHIHIHIHDHVHVRPLPMRLPNRTAAPIHDCLSSCQYSPLDMCARLQGRPAPNGTFPRLAGSTCTTSTCSWIARTSARALLAFVA